MSTVDRTDWHRTSPLAAVFYLGKIYRAIAQNAFQALAPLLAFLFAYQGNLISKIVFGTVTFVLVTLGIAFVRYWFFRYRITGHSILIRDGVIRKTQLDIKFDRVQALTTQQNILFRAFGLVTVKLDTAGSAGQEGHLPAVRSGLLIDLKERIRHQSKAADSNVDTVDDGTGIETEPDVYSRELLRLRAADMIRIGLSSNRALIFLVLLGPLIDRFETAIEEKVDENTLLAAVQSMQSSISGNIGLGAIVLIVFLLFLVFASVVGAFLRYHQFRLVADNEVLRSSAGLLTRHEHSVNLAKVQSVLITQNLMQRMFRRFRLQGKQASSGKPDHRLHFVIPLCDSGQLAQLGREVFGEEFPGVVLEPAAAEFLPIARQYFRSRFILTGVMPAIVLTALLLPLGPGALILLLAWPPLSALVVWHHYRRYGVLVTRDGVALRRGFVGYRVTAFLHRKVQRISLTQSLLQRCKGLATLRFYLASGSVKVPYVNFKKACALRDHVLYRIESSHIAWH